MRRWHLGLTGYKKIKGGWVGIEIAYNCLITGLKEKWLGPKNPKKCLRNI